MIYLDSSVLLSQLLVEDRRPPAWLWRRALVASRLLQYEVWNRVHAYGRAEQLGSDIALFLNRILLIELDAGVLARALEPLPERPRTLDALHLATAAFVRDNHSDLLLASYDQRMLACAEAMRIGIVRLD